MDGCDAMRLVLRCLAPSQLEIPLLFLYTLLLSPPRSPSFPLPSALRWEEYIYILPLAVVTALFSACDRPAAANNPAIHDIPPPPPLQVDSTRPQSPAFGSCLPTHSGISLDHSSDCAQRINTLPTFS